MSLSTDVVEDDYIPTALWHQIFMWLNNLDLFAEFTDPCWFREGDVVAFVRMNANELEFATMNFPKGWFFFEELLFPPFSSRQSRLNDEDMLEFLRDA